MLPKVHDPLRNELLTIAIGSLGKIASQKERVATLVQLSYHTVAPHNETDLINDAYQVMLTMESEEERWEAMTTLIAVLPKRRIQEAFTTELSITAMESVFLLLDPLRQFLLELDHASLYVVWKRIMHVLASSTRQEFLLALGKMTPIIKKLGSETAVVATVEAIQTVRQWLP